MTRSIEERPSDPRRIPQYGEHDAKKVSHDRCAFSCFQNTLFNRLTPNTAVAAVQTKPKQRTSIAWKNTSLMKLVQARYDGSRASTATYSKNRAKPCTARGSAHDSGA